MEFYPSLGIAQRVRANYRWLIGATSLACVMILAVSFLARSQETGGSELAQLLADSKTRESTVQMIVGDGTRRIPLLLSWARRPPAGVDSCSLYIGLADVFGRLKTRDSIPFLIKNIGSLRRTCDVDLAPWLKAPETIEEMLPAMGALIQIGPEAARALIRASEGPMRTTDRRAAIFAVAHIKGAPEAYAFLSSVVAEAAQERHWAEEGLSSLGVQK
jgi:hypothetical protein